MKNIRIFLSINMNARKSKFGINNRKSSYIDSWKHSHLEENWSVLFAGLKELDKAHHCQTATVDHCWRWWNCLFLWKEAAPKNSKLQTPYNPHTNDSVRWFLLLRACSHNRTVTTVLLNGSGPVRFRFGSTTESVLRFCFTGEAVPIGSVPQKNRFHRFGSTQKSEPNRGSSY